MSVVVIILLVILVLVCGIRAIDSIDPNRDSLFDFLSVIGIAIFSIVLGVLVTYREEAEMTNKRQPTVYKGKTTLKVTETDSVVIIIKDK